MKHELQYIISGTRQVKHGATIQAIASYLRNGKSPSDLAKKSISFKKQEESLIEQFATTNKLWIVTVNIENFVSSGAEQLVYLKNDRIVIKLNDSIYYETWEDYFNNLLLNNYFFPDTAYQLLGFYKNDKAFYAVVEQNFVIATEKTELLNVKLFLENSGFINKKNNDYFHPELGIILEDLHDENVITQDGVLKFIDTVFFITDAFYN
jgi:Serine/Threonine/Tyrosine Kinase found in polyvalent proteins